MALSQKDLGSIPGQSVLGKLLNLIGSQLLIYKAGEWYLKATLHGWSELCL